MPNVLFVCARNKWRSPTAEKVFARLPGINVASAGLSPKSPRRLGVKQLQWADMIYVMEDEHKKRIIRDYSAAYDLPPIQSLDIADEYEFMDSELVERLRNEVEPLLLTLIE